MTPDEMLELRLQGEKLKQIAAKAGVTMAWVSASTNNLYRQILAKRRSDQDVAERGLLATHVNQLGLSSRALLVLQNEGFQTVEDLLLRFPALLEQPLANIPGVGKGTIAELKEIPAMLTRFS